MIDDFTGDYLFLSNFYYPVWVSLDGFAYPSTEHAYQAAKTFNTFSRWEIREAKHPGAAKKLGRKVDLRLDWEDVKIPIMEDLLIQKFNQEPLRTWLLNTGTEELVEGNYWGDTFWGVCRGEGSNHLGKLLMKIREQL